MTASKCSKCGFVSARDRETCKRCDAAITGPSSARIKKPGSRRFVILAVSIAVAVVVVLAACGIVLAMLGGEKPTSSEVVSLLLADEQIARPVNLWLPTKISLSEDHDGGGEQYLTDRYVEGRVFKDLGLVTSTFTLTKAEKQKCQRYDKVLRPHPVGYRDAEHGGVWVEEDPYVKYVSQNGRFEECNDAWDYRVEYTFDDPAAIDPAAMPYKVRQITDINDKTPPQVRGVVGEDLDTAKVRAVAGENTGFGAVVLPIGAIEIVEVSDAISGSKPGTYTVGFKFRFKPNALGELYDVTSEIHKSLPPGVRGLFANVPSHDKRFTYVTAIQRERQNRRDPDGLIFGHAELTSVGFFNPKWKVEGVYLDLLDDARARYTFHPVK